jgi:hypothetical protein
MTKVATKNGGSTAVEPAQTTALAPVSHALVGSLQEKVTAFDQIGAAMAQLQLNGWDTVQKCKAGFWLADGIGEHPAVFLQNHYVMDVKGKLIVEPKWKYQLKKMKERIPGFRFRVLIEADDCAKIEVSDGRDTHVVEYTLADAKRQGLLGRGGNAWTGGSTKEMCLVRATKRGIDRLGGDYSAAWVDTEMEVASTSGAEVVEDEPASVGTDPARGAREDGGSAVGTAPDPIRLLRDEIVTLYGKLPMAAGLAKATFVYNQMVLAETGADPHASFKKLEDIGPVDAQRMVEYLRAHREKRAKDDAERDAPVEDQPPAAETEVEPEAEAAPEPDEGDAYETFMLAVRRAKKVFGRKFLVEAPSGSGKFWFIDQTTFSQAGFESSQKVMDGDEVVMPTSSLAQLAKIMATDCDAEERGRK